MKTIDSHIHFWDLKNNINNWVFRVNNPSLEKNYMPDVIASKFNGDLYGVVHIEAHDSDIPTINEVSWLSSIMKANPKLKYSHIAFVDITLPNAQFSNIIEELKEYKNVVGIRHILSYNPKFDYSPCDTDLSKNPNIHDNLGCLAKNNLIFNCQMYPYQINNILPAVTTSGVTCVVDHFALPAWNEKGDTDHNLWQEIMTKLSILDNVFIKISGIDMFRKESEYKEVVQFCLDKFPINRLIYGSNYPVSFNSNFNYWYEYLNNMNLSSAEKEQIFFKNACKVFFCSEF
jgi:L-fuconolactonase